MNKLQNRQIFAIIFLIGEYLMDCSKKFLTDFLVGAGTGVSNVQFVIPIYQRNYAWDTSLCERLLNDIYKLANRIEEKKDVFPHFCGSIVYGMEEKTSGIARINSCSVVDGQQRLTTLALILKALFEISTSLTSPSVSFETRIIPEFKKGLYINPQLEDDGFKLMLHTKDHEEFEAIMNNKTLNPVISKEIRDNYNYILKSLTLYVGSNEDKISYVLNALEKLQICWIQLEKNDNAQEIFETLNSLRKELTLADLARNFILMQMTQDEIEKYHPIWQKIEENCGSEENLNDFLRTFLIYYYNSNDDLNKNTPQPYFKFKEYAKIVMDKYIDSGKPKIDGLDDILREIEKLSSIYSYIVYGTCAGSVRPSYYSKYVEKAFEDFRTLKMATVHPFLMHIAVDCLDKKISVDMLEKVLSFILTQIIRSAFKGESDKSFNSFFATLHKNAFGNKTGDYVDLLYTHFMHNEKIISDSDFEDDVINYPIYKKRSVASYVLKSIENCGKATIVDFGSIEHILPQSGDRSGAWKKDLGIANFERIQKQYAHRLGNLTLLISNSELGDSSFKIKLDTYKNPTESKIKILNEDIVSIPKTPKDPIIWNDINIEERGKRLAGILINGISAPGSKSIPPLFGYPAAKYVGCIAFNEVLADLPLIKGPIFAYKLQGSEIQTIPVNKRKRPLKEMLKSIVEYLYENGYETKMKSLASGSGTSLLPGKLTGKTMHLIDNIMSVEEDKRVRYYKVGDIYYYNHFSTEDIVEFIKNLLLNLKISHNDLIIYKI